MESLYVLIPIALLLAGAAIAAFLWAVRSRQFDDLEMEGKRLLFDDEGDNGNDGKTVSRKAVDSEKPGANNPREDDPRDE